MKWLSNTHDPKDENAPMYDVPLPYETEAWKRHLEWLNGKVIGEPRVTEVYTVEQLKEMGMVGVYST